MSDFTQFVDLASARLGGVVLAANDEFFAPKENLLKPSKPVFMEDKYTDRGKWMDGWETRRRRTPGFDWCIVRLGVAGIVRGIVLDTSYFTGNYPEACSVEACALDEDVGDELGAVSWTQIVPRTALQGDSRNLIAVTDAYRCTHLRLNIYPDGGVARLRVHGEAAPDWRRVLAAGGGAVDLAAVENGGRVVACSDMFFSHPQNLLMPGQAANMGDGWETRRRRGPGFDWVILQLGAAARVQRVILETTHFKGNFPESASLEGACPAPGEDVASGSIAWHTILPRTGLRADSRHCFEPELASAGAVSHVRLNIFPDGGVARLRVLGSPDGESRQAALLGWLNSIPPYMAQREFLSCCGSDRWAEQMAGARPFAGKQQLMAAAEKISGCLGREDWLQAFAAHPQIGATKAAQPGREAAWSHAEQADVRRAAARTLAELAETNQQYLARFGHIFIICASGKPADEMLTALRQRLGNDPATELRIAADEQRKITRLRLEKLLEP